jgi:hypothetical protein
MADQLSKLTEICYGLYDYCLHEAVKTGNPDTAYSIFFDNGLDTPEFKKYIGNNRKFILESFTSREAPKGDLESFTSREAPESFPTVELRLGKFYFQIIFFKEKLFFFGAPKKIRPTNRERSSRFNFFL